MMTPDQWKQLAEFAGVELSSVWHNGNRPRIYGDILPDRIWRPDTDWSDFGPQWGDGGFCGLPYSIVDEPFFEAWLIRDFAGYAVPESPGIKLEIKNRFVIDARVVPTPDLIGTTTNVWIAAKLPSGQIFMKQSLDTDEFKPLVWPEFPIAGQLLLQEDTRLSVIKWMNLEPYVGAEIYVACGQSPLNWHLVKLCTI